MNYYLKFQLNNFDNEFLKSLVLVEEILEKFPETYKMALSQTLTSYKNETCYFQKLKILQNFGVKFLVIPEIEKQITIFQQHLLNIIPPTSPSENMDTLSILSKFRQRLTFSSKKYQNEKCLEWNIDVDQWFDWNHTNEWYNCLNEPEKLLNFPHRYLDRALYFCKRRAARPLDEKAVLQLERFKFFYEEFMRDNLQHDEWILYLNEIDDDEVVIGLFEHRLGWKKECLNKNFWKLYMNFLKEKDQIAYLNVYRRYTRFFIEDKEMIEEYRSEIERISKIPAEVAEFWNDTILYEVDFGCKNTTLKVLERALACSKVPHDELNILLNVQFSEFPLFITQYCESIANSTSKKENLEPTKMTSQKCHGIQCYFPKNKIENLKKTQNFSFHRTFIFYITQKVKHNHKILKKLFNSCKYFFAIQPTPLCHRLVLGCQEPSKYRDQSLFLNIKDLDFAGLDNLYIVNAFDISGQYPATYSDTYQRLYRCDAKYGTIFSQVLTIPELKFIPDWRKMIGYWSEIVHEGITYSFRDNDLIYELYEKTCM